MCWRLHSRGCQFSLRRVKNRRVILMLDMSYDIFEYVVLSVCSWFSDCMSCMFNNYDYWYSTPVHLLHPYIIFDQSTKF